MKNKGRYHYGLLYTLKGTEIYTFFDKTVYACPGSVLIIPKNEAYQIDLYDEESIAIAIDFELADDINIRPVFIKNIGNNNIKSLFTDAVSEWKKHDFDYIPGLKSIFYRIISFLTLQENSYHSSTNYKKIAKAIEYMNDHYLESDFKIEKLALLSGISTRYFEKLFRSIFFVTPRDYIISRKIELAKELLQSEKSSLLICFLIFFALHPQIPTIAHLILLSVIHYITIFRTCVYIMFKQIITTFFCFLE